MSFIILLIALLLLAPYALALAASFFLDTDKMDDIAMLLIFKILVTLASIPQICLSFAVLDNYLCGELKYAAMILAGLLQLCLAYYLIDLFCWGKKKLKGPV